MSKEQNKEPKGLAKPLKLKKDLAAMLKVDTLSRTEIISKLWDYIKKNNLKTKKENGTPSGEGAHIVVDAVLHSIVKNTNTKSKEGVVTDLRNVKEGQTIHMMKLASVISANVE